MMALNSTLRPAESTLLIGTLIACDSDPTGSPGPQFAPENTEAAPDGTDDGSQSRLCLGSNSIGTESQPSAVTATGVPVRIGMDINVAGVVVGYTAHPMDSVRVFALVHCAEPFTPLRNLSSYLGLRSLDTSDELLDSSEHGNTAIANDVQWVTDSGFGWLFCD